MGGREIAGSDKRDPGEGPCWVDWTRTILIWLGGGDAAVSYRDEDGRPDPIIDSQWSGSRNYFCGCSGT